MYKYLRLLGCFLLVSLSTSAQFTMTFRKSFLDSLKNKVTISSNFTVYYAHDHANSAIKDGDLHFSGYDPKIGIPVVSEIMNAKEEDDCVELVKEKKGDDGPGEKLKITGAWRLWSEHISAGAAYYQGMGDEEITSTGPNHIFEIHPITKVEDFDLFQSVRNIEDYEATDGRTAFKSYLKISSEISLKNNKVTIKTKGAKYNYADFWIKLNTTEKYVVSDGLFVYCQVFAADFDPEEGNEPEFLLHGKIRMAFIEGTEAYEEVKNLKKGKYLHVLGIPRISLVEVMRRVKDRNSDPDGLEENLPIEMIVVGLYD